VDKVEGAGRLNIQNLCRVPDLGHLAKAPLCRVPAKKSQFSNPFCQFIEFLVFIEI
jgi:hypothetical protein